MRRRELLTLLCGGGAGIFGLQIEASAQTPTTARRVAFVVSTGPVNQREHEFFRAFVDELRNLGYVEGRHLTLEGYSGEGRFDRLAELARSIVETGPEVIVAATDPVARAFNEATATIPLVVACSDPVALGFAQSMARPGGNITGIAVYAGPVILEKYVEIIREIDPRILRIGVLAQKLSWEKHHDIILKNFADRLGVQLIGPPLEPPVDEEEYRRVVAVMAGQRVQALVADLSGANFTYAGLIAELARAYRLPALSAYARHSQAGGLISYATDLQEQFRRMAGQVDRILKGDRPGDLPFHLPTRFRLVLNSKTAQALGLTIPPNLLARADEVIE
jgi:putative tryptophan/tyrosine transport system substrate-binding protein